MSGSGGVVPGLCGVEILCLMRHVLQLYKLDLIHSLRMATHDESHARTMASVNSVGGPRRHWAPSPFQFPHQASLGWEEPRVMQETVGSPSQDPMKVHL